MWSIGNEVPERTGVSDGVAWCRAQADCVRALDDTRFVTSALPALFEEMGPPPEDADMEMVFGLLNSPPDETQGDPWGTRTEAFCENLDVVGYNYFSKRYAYDGERFEDRVICGEETFPHQAFASWEATTRQPSVIGDFVWTAIDYLGEAGIGRVYVDEPLTFAAQHPYHLANCGDFDICGFKRPQSYFRDILWGERTQPYIGVLDPQLCGSKISFTPWGWEPVVDSWTFPGQEGKRTEVHVYSADDEVELLINGVSVGRKPAGAENENKAVFDVTYQAGQIVAIGYTDGLERGRMTLNSAGEPAGLRLTPDRTSIKAETSDLVYLTVEVIDAQGERVCNAEHEIQFEIVESGKLIAVGTANPVSEEPYVGNRRKAYQGRLMAVIRSAGSAGKIRVKATADGLDGAEVVLA